ncbi:MAG: DMT family transporter [Hyphomicrobiaceae bacterium]
MLVLALLWGLSIPITKLALGSLPPLGLTALRFAIAAPLLLVFTVGQRGLPLAALPAVVGLGLLGLGIGNVSQVFGIASTSASVGTVISATIPVFIVVLAAVRLKQPVSALQLLGLAAAFAGIALVAFEQGEGQILGQTTWMGVGLMLLSAIAIALYYVWSVELTIRFGTIPVIAWSTLAGFFVLVPWAY